MKALVTGAAGFVGSHLVELLLENGYSVVALDREPSMGCNLTGLRGTVDFRSCDVVDATALTGLVEEVQPDEVYHLAAIASVPAALANPRLTIEVNVLGTLNVLEAVRMACPGARVLSIGSAHEYGEVREADMPIREDSVLRPVDPYAVSKASATMLACQYFRAFGVKAICTRAFNHIGPRQSPAFAASAFAKQIAEAETRKREPRIEVGDLSARRDFTDVRDVVRAYWLLAQRGKAGEVYNICSGRAVAIRDVLERLIALASMTVEVVADPARFRPSDIPILVGDCGKLRAATGWEPQIPLEQTLRDTLDNWRAEIRGIENQGQ